MAKKKQKQQQKQPEKVIEIPLGLSEGVIRHIELNARRWEMQGNDRMAEELQNQANGRREQQREFMLENGMEIPEEKKEKPKQTPKSKKKKKREFNGDTKPELIEQAIKALKPAYPMGVDSEGNEVWEDPLEPTSVEVFKDFARIWFEYDEGVDEDGGHVSEFEFSMTAPIYYFWGRKKREKYLKENRRTVNWETLERGGIVLAEYRPLNDGFEGRTYGGSVLEGFYVDSIEEIHAKVNMDGPTPGWEGKIRINDFFMDSKEQVIVMPANMDQSRLIHLNNSTKTDFDKSYVVYSGSRYGEDKSTHAHVYNTKEGYDHMVEVLINWYS